MTATCRKFLREAEAQSRVCVTLLSGDSFYFRAWELNRLMAHRYVLAHYVVAILLFTVLQVRADLALLTPGVRFILSVSFLLVMLLGLGLGLFLAERFVRPLGGFVRVPLSAILLASSAAGLLATHGMVLVLAPALGATVWQLLVLWAFFYVAVEAATHLVMYLAVPRAAGELRSRQAGAPALVAGRLHLAGEVIELDALLWIRAEGNYVTVATQEGRKMLPGPFGAVVALLSVSVGVRIGRSHWVAARAVRSGRRTPGGLVIALRDGTELPVAQARRKAVEAWLAEAGIAPDQRAGSAMSTQSG